MRVCYVEVRRHWWLLAPPVVVVREDYCVYILCTYSRVAAQHQGWLSRMLYFCPSISGSYSNSAGGARPPESSLGG